MSGNVEAVAMMNKRLADSAAMPGCAALSAMRFEVRGADVCIIIGTCLVGRGPTPRGAFAALVANFNRYDGNMPGVPATFAPAVFAWARAAL